MRKRGRRFAGAFLFAMVFAGSYAKADIFNYSGAIADPNIASENILEE
jgi:hypothetical protein